MKFKDIEIGSYFMFNGNKYLKNSNCSAKLLSTNRVRYFTQKEIIHVELGAIQC